MIFQKKNESDIYFLEKMAKPKKNMNLFRIPTNLIVYIKAINGSDKDNIDKRFSKYLKSNYIIFNNVEEFIEKYILTEKTMLNHLRNSLIQNNFNEYEKIKLMKKINIMEKENKIFENDFKRTKKYYDKTKIDNDYYGKKYDKLSMINRFNKIEKEKKIKDNLDSREIKYKKFLETEKFYANI